VINGYVREINELDPPKSLILHKRMVLLYSYCPFCQRGMFYTSRHKRVTKIKNFFSFPVSFFFFGFFLDVSFLILKIEII